MSGLGDEVIDEPVIEEEPGAAAESRADIERRARAMGWKPKDEYRGPPGNWRDAEEFLRVGETEIPVMRDNLRTMERRLTDSQREVEALRGQVGDLTGIAEELRAMARKADERGYQRALAELKAKQRDAVAQGDTAAYDAIEAEINAAETERRTAAPAREPEKKPNGEASPRVPPPAPAVKDFMVRNDDWFNRNQDMTTYAVNYDATLKNDPDWRDVSDEDRLKEVERVTREKFSRARGGDPPPRQEPQRRAASVAAPRGGNEPPRRPASADPFAVIADATERAEAKAAYERMKSYMPGYTAQEYMAVYGDPKVDVLSVQEEARKRAKA